MAKKIKVTLTNARPVNIDPDLWPCIAEGSDRNFQGEYDFQANWMSKWSLKVRQHVNGCALVYGSYSYTSQYQDAHDYDIRGGMSIKPGGDLVAAIREVAADLESAVKDNMPDDAATFRRIARECIADLPPDDDFDCAANAPEVLA